MTGNEWSEVRWGKRCLHSVGLLISILRPPFNCESRMILTGRNHILSHTDLKKDRWSGEKPMVVPTRDRQLIGVIPPLVKPRVDERRYISEQIISPAKYESSPSPTVNVLLATKGALFESKIKAERPQTPFASVEVVARPTPKPFKGLVPTPTPPSTPRPILRATADPKKLLSQRIIFLNDHTGNCKFGSTVGAASSLQALVKLY